MVSEVAYIFLEVIVAFGKMWPAIISDVNIFWKSASNSTGDLGPRGECIPSGIVLQQRLTTPPKVAQVGLQLALICDF